MQVGIFGTGYAARARGLALQADGRATLRWFVGRDPQKTETLAQEFQTKAYTDWRLALADPLVDLVFVGTANSSHEPLVRQALLVNKHVVVEYPLALTYAQAVALVALAQERGCLLHVEHIELLSTIHHNLKTELTTVGQPLYVRYTTQTPAHPAPERWSYNLEIFGFPLIGAVSRLGRLIDLLGEVTAVRCQNQYTDVRDGYFQSCYCAAQLTFASGTIGDLLYAKGVGVWRSQVILDIQGMTGSLHLDRETITVYAAGEPRILEAGGRRGLFLRDTQAVLDHLLEDKLLYISQKQALYAMQVAEACAESAATGDVVRVLADNC